MARPVEGRRCHPEFVEGLSRPALIFALLALAACSGNFSSGTQSGPLPPPGASSGPFTSNGTATATPAVKSSATPGPAVYPLADAANGFACPETLPEYSCQIRFNVPPPTPTPSPNAKQKVKPKATPTPSPTPSPSPSPLPSTIITTNANGGNAAATPAPSSTAPTITLVAEAQPTAAPAMVHVPKDVTKVVSLMTVTITTSADFPLDGLAIASFTLPKDQIAGRGFALQLFLQRMQGKTKTYAPVLSLDKSSLQKNTLVFGFTPPKITVAKNMTYVLALYGTQIGSPAPASGAPSATPSAAPTATPSP